MASLIKWLGKEADKIIPGDQSYLHNGQAGQKIQQAIQQAPQAAQQVIQHPGNFIMHQATPVVGHAIDRGVSTVAHSMPGLNVASAVLDRVTPPKIKSALPKPSQMVGGTLQSIPQIGVRTANSLMGTNFTPHTDAEKYLVGNAKIGQFKDYTQDNLGGLGKMVGINKVKTGNDAIDTLIGIGGSALDAVPVALPKQTGTAGLKATEEVGRELKAGLPQVRNERGYIGGPNAKTYTDKQATGKLQGNSFETSDAGMKVKGKGAAKAEAGQTVPLSDVIKHPQLKEDYKHFFNKDSGLKVTVDPKAMQSTIDHNTGLITIAKVQAPHLNTPTGQSRLMEEIQHSVDAHEGRVSGTTPAIEKIHAQPEEVKQAARVASTLRPQVIALQDLVRRGNMTKAEFEAHPTVQAFKRTSAVSKSAPALTDQQAMERYLANEGEQRAKTVASRQGMTQKQIDQNPLNIPWVDPAREPQPRVAASADEKLPIAPQTLNTNRLNISEDAKGEVNALSAPDELQHLSNKDVEQFSKQVGIDTRSHNIEEQRNIIARQLNLRKDIVTMTNQADRLLEDGDLSGRAQLLKQIAEMGRTSTEQGSSVARQLQARRILANELDTPLQRVFKLLDAAGINPDLAAEKMAGVDFNDANAVVRAYRELVPPTKGNWLDTVRYNSMLSSPLTQINNIVPNLLSTAGVTPVEKVLTGTIDAIKSAVTGAPREHMAGEGVAYTKGYFKSFGEAKKRFSDSLSGKAEAANLDMKGHVPMYAHGQNGIYDTLSFPMRLMEAMDGFFTGLTEGGVTKALEYRESKGIKVNQPGLSEAPTSQEIQTFAVGRKVSPSDRNNIGTVTAVNPDKQTVTLHFKSKDGFEADKEFPFSEIGFLKSLRKTDTGFVNQGGNNVIKNTAEAESAYRLYRQQLGDDSQGHFLKALDIPAQKLMELRNSKNPYVALPAKFTVPFVRTTMNIFKQGFEYSPAGVVTLHGAANKTEQLSKMVLGTAVTGAAAALLGQNRLTWAQPTNQKQKEAWQAAGMQPYSVKIGNNWVSFQKLPPALSFNLALIAALDDAHKNSKINQNGIDNALTAMSKYGQFLSDQSYTKSAGNFLKAVQGDPQATTQLISSYPQQLVPGRALMNWIATATDNTQRKVNKDAPIWKQQVEALEQVIPGLRKTTTALTGPDGAPIPAQHPLINAVSPAKISTEDPAAADYYGMLKQKSLDDSNKRITKADAKKNGTDVKASTDSTAATDDKMQTRLDNANKKLPKGISDGSKGTLLEYARLTDKGKSVFESDPKKVYNLHSAQYEQDKLSGKLSTAEDFKKQKALRTESITSDYSKDVTEMHSMSKGDLQAFLNANPDKQKLVNQVLELDQKLANATGTKTKFGGTVATKAKGRKGTGVKVAKAKRTSTGIPSYGKAAGMGSLLRNSVLKGIKAPANKKPHQAAKPKIAKIKMSGKGSSKFA